MCGICGMSAFAGQSISQARLMAMTEAMVHRGPDEDGFFVEGGIGLGMRRLSIVDVACGHQPLQSEDGNIVLVCNGEIYNCVELRQGLVARGHVFSTATDVEVIVHLFEEQGIACVKDLRGMFAFALYDRREQTLFLGRDAFGIKPLYYAKTARALAFSSDVRSLLASGLVQREMNMQALWDFLTFQYVPGTDTMLRDIVCLPPGHTLMVRRGEMCLRRFFEPVFAADDSRSLRSFANELRETLYASVDAHRLGDLPCGAFLSSGIDSSLIATLLARQEGSGDVQTFSVGFENASAGHDELGIARETAALIGTRHHETVISAQRFQDALPAIVAAQEDPVADPSAIALYFLAELASPHVTVVLSGEGADELFGGYPIYHEPISLRPLAKLPPSLRSGAATLAQMLPEGMKGRGFLQRGSQPLERRFIGNAKLWSEEAKERLLALDEGERPRASFRFTDEIYKASEGCGDVTRMQLIDLQTWLPGDILAKADKMTMAHSLELRVPFLDRDVFALAARVPERYRVGQGVTKRVLREAAAGILPDGLRARPKLGFPVPLRAFLSGPMAAFARETLLGGGGAGRLFNRDLVAAMLEDHIAGRRDHARLLWAVLIFTLWHRSFIEEPGAFRPAVSPFVATRPSRARTRGAAGI